MPINYANMRKLNPKGWSRLIGLSTLGLAPPTAFYTKAVIEDNKGTKKSKRKSDQYNALGTLSLGLATIPAARSLTKRLMYRNKAISNASSSADKIRSSLVANKQRFNNFNEQLKLYFNANLADDFKGELDFAKTQFSAKTKKIKDNAGDLNAYDYTQNFDDIIENLRTNAFDTLHGFSRKKFNKDISPKLENLYRNQFKKMDVNNVLTPDEINRFSKKYSQYDHHRKPIEVHKDIYRHVIEKERRYRRNRASSGGYSGSSSGGYSGGSSGGYKNSGYSWQYTKQQGERNYKTRDVLDFLKLVNLGDKVTKKEEVRKAYKKFMMKNHPDINKSPNATENSKAMNALFDKIKESSWFEKLAYYYLNRKKIF